MMLLPANRAFSLIELSIVLVILGLLTGGILAGQSLIRAAELRSVSVEYSRYTTAIYSFRDKYFAIPGDMTNATMIWGKNTSACNAHTGSVPASGVGTCNGNGNGIITNTNQNQTAENMQFWTQLALAGLIEGSYTGITGAGGPGNATRANVPASRMANGLWYTINWQRTAAQAEAQGFIAVDVGNAFEFGVMHAQYDPLTPIMKAEEMWNVDTKVDDGMPGLGKVVARGWNNACSTGGASAYDLGNMNYNLSNTTVGCVLVGNNPY